MIKLKTSSIKVNRRLLASFVNAEDDYFKFIYLDFEERKIRFRNSLVWGTLNVDFEGTGVKNFFVDTQIFLNLCDRYSVLNIDEKMKFSSGSDKFIIPVLDTENNFDEFTIDNDRLSKFSSDRLQALKEASIFATEDEGELAGVKVTKDYIVASDFKMFYLSTIKSDKTFEVNIPNYIVRLFSYVGADMPVSLYVEDSVFYVKLGNDIDLVCSELVDLDLPEPLEGDFLEKYNHADHFVFNKSKMVEHIKFIYPFVKIEVNTMFFLKIKSQTELILRTNTDVISEMVLDISDCSPKLVGEEVIISATNFLKMIEKIEDTEIEFRYDASKPAYSIIGKEKKDKILIHVNLKA